MDNDFLDRIERINVLQTKKYRAPHKLLLLLLTLGRVWAREPPLAPYETYERPLKKLLLDFGHPRKVLHRRGRGQPFPRADLPAGPQTIRYPPKAWGATCVPFVGTLGNILCVHEERSNDNTMRRRSLRIPVTATARPRPRRPRRARTRP